jgi:predicted RNA-binding protein with PUA-like domain
MPRYWVLNCKEEQFDFRAALNDEEILRDGMTWKVSEKWNEMLSGDVYFIYVAAPYQSIVACGFIEEAVQEIACDDNSAKYWNDKSKGKRARRTFISIGHKFDPYVKSIDINPEGTDPVQRVPLGQQGSNKQIPPLAAIRMMRVLGIELS